MPADADDQQAAGQLASLLADHGDLEGSRARADAGSEPAAEHLADLLAKRGDLDEREQILCALTDYGGINAAEQLVDLIVKQRRGKETSSCAGSA